MLSAHGLYVKEHLLQMFIFIVCFRPSLVHTLFAIVSMLYVFTFVCTQIFSQNIKATDKL